MTLASSRFYYYYYCCCYYYYCYYYYYYCYYYYFHYCYYYYYYSSSRFGDIALPGLLVSFLRPRPRSVCQATLAYYILSWYCYSYLFVNVNMLSLFCFLFSNYYFNVDIYITIFVFEGWLKLFWLKSTLASLAPTTSSSSPSPPLPRCHPLRHPPPDPACTSPTPSCLALASHRCWIPSQSSSLGST